MDFKIDPLGREITLNGETVALLDGERFTPTKAGRKYRLAIAEFLSQLPAAPMDPAMATLVEAARTPDTPFSAPPTADLSEAPPMDPMLGDKTPAFVEWLHKHNPVEFARRYKNRKTHITDALPPSR